MTLTELYARLRMMVGNPDTTNVPDATLLPYINAAYTQIATRYRFHRNRVRNTLNTVAGTSAYSLNASDRVLYNVWNKTDGYELEKASDLDMAMYDRSESDPSFTGRPLKYLRNADTITLFPPPDAVYVIELLTQRTVTALATGSDIPTTLPDTWHESIVLWARWMYYDTVGDYPKAQYAYNQLQLWLKDRPNEFDEEDLTYRDSIEVVPLSRGLRRTSQNFHTSDW